MLEEYNCLINYQLYKMFQSGDIEPMLRDIEPMLFMNARRI